jgi:hypothetical protein
VFSHQDTTVTSDEQPLGIPMAATQDLTATVAVKNQDFAVVDCVVLRESGPQLTAKTVVTQSQQEVTARTPRQAPSYLSRGEFGGHSQARL